MGGYRRGFKGREGGREGGREEVCSECKVVNGSKCVHCV